MAQKTVEAKSLEYLEDRDSAGVWMSEVREEFTSPASIPFADKGERYWSLVVESTQFPGETFAVVRDQKGVKKPLHFWDEIVKEPLTTDCIIRFGWDTGAWPEGMGKVHRFRNGWMREEASQRRNYISANGVLRYYK